MTHTYTLSSLPVSPQTYDEIAALLKAAGWDHAFHNGGIDMTHVLLVRDELDPTKQCPGCREDTARELTAHGDAARRFFCVARCGQAVWEVPFSSARDDDT